MASRLRSRNRFGGLTQYARMRDVAIAAARRNNASLWFAGAPADLAGFVWQDSAGTTPATGTDPIGLLLDRQYGPANLGTELAPLGWTGATVNTGASVVGGLISMAACSPGFVAFRDGTAGISSNKTYQVQCDLVGVTQPVQFLYQGIGVVSGTGTTTLRGVFSSGTVTNARLQINNNGGSTANGTITLSVREVLGIPVLQVTAANKPTLSPNSAGYLDMSFDVTNDTLSAALASGGSPVVVSFTDTGEVTGFVSATTSGFVIGNPTIGGRKVGVIVASATALPAADLAAIRAFAGVVRGTPYP